MLLSLSLKQIRVALFWNFYSYFIHQHILHHIIVYTRNDNAAYVWKLSQNCVKLALNQSNIENGDDTDLSVPQALFSF